MENCNTHFDPSFPKTIKKLIPLQFTLTWFLQIKIRVKSIIHLMCSQICSCWNQLTANQKHINPSDVALLMQTSTHICHTHAPVYASNVYPCSSKSNYTMTIAVPTFKSRNSRIQHWKQYRLIKQVSTFWSKSKPAPTHFKARSWAKTLGKVWFKYQVPLQSLIKTTKSSLLTSYERKLECWEIQTVMYRCRSICPK